MEKIGHRPTLKPITDRLCVSLLYGMMSVILPALAVEPAHVTPIESSSTAIPSFEVIRFDVQGNTLLSQAEIDVVLQPFLGKSQNFSHVQRALEALEALYHQKGFKVVQVLLPEQELNQGVVKLNVIEARIAKVTVEGQHFFDIPNIRRSLPLLQEGATPNIEVISTHLRMANENPAKKISLSLQTSEKDGEVDALLKVSDEKPWTLSSTLDNTGNRSTGRSRLSMSYQHANIANRDHIMSLQYTTSTEYPNRVNIYGMGYHLPIYRYGDSIDVFASHSDVDSGSVMAGLVDLRVSGKGSVLGARYNQNLKRIGEYQSKLVYGIDYRTYQNDVMWQGTQLGNDVIVHPLSLSYMGEWSSVQRQFNAYISAVRNIPGGRDGREADFSRTRSEAISTYRLLRYGADYRQPLPKNWQFHLGLNGQYTQDSLIPGEQFGAGGANSVRGFSERELSDDKGHSISAEVYTPNLCSGMQCHILMFYDIAKLSRNHPSAGESTTASIASVGIGMRIVKNRFLSMQIDYGHVLDAGGSQDKGDNQWHIKIGLAY